MVRDFIQAAGFCQKLPQAHHKHQMAREDQEHGPMGKDQAEPKRTRHQETKMAMDRAHVKKTNELYYPAGPTVESPRKKKSGKTTHKLEKLGYKWQDLTKLTQNRKEWRSIVGSLCTTSAQKA